LRQLATGIKLDESDIKDMALILQSGIWERFPEIWNLDAEILEYLANLEACIIQRPVIEELHGYEFFSPH
jgi:hypothetical protein